MATTTEKTARDSGQGAGSKGARLEALAGTGQSVWLDSISRELMGSGELKELIEVIGIRGMTSNPTIFEKAINGSPSYDREIALLADKGYGTEQIVRFLMVRDIRKACDFFLPVHRKTGGNDGFVSIEVSPLLSADTDNTVKEAKLLHFLVDRPNLMVKVPGTPEGMPAIETLTGEGISINVTLLFSPDAYRNAAMAYVRGATAYLGKGGDLSKVHSVASVFVSRIDTLVDKELECRVEAATGSGKASLEALAGQAGIANCQTIYHCFEEIFRGEKTRHLSGKEFRLQRPLWASTGTKNPKYSDTLYVDSLIAPDTVNTVPMATLKAFVDHGQVSPALVANKNDPQKLAEALKGVGINLDDVFRILVAEGVKSFEQSFETLNKAISDKVRSMVPGKPATGGLPETTRWSHDMKDLIEKWESNGVS